jgi:tetratricopeptide (TPR) repeat protein
MPPALKAVLRNVLTSYFGAKMKGWIFLLLAAMVPALFTLSCGEKEADEETLLLYAGAAGLYREGRFSETAAALSEVKQFFPAVLLRGKAEFLSGSDEAAERSLRRALALKPGSADAALSLARLLREKGRAAEAEALVEGVLGEDPQNIRALRLGADLARDKGPAGEADALVFLNRAAEASFEAALVFLDRARFRWEGGKGEEALEDLKRARTLLPGDVPLVKSIEKLESVILEVLR